MKKQLLILFTILCAATVATAQKEYKVAKSSGHLILNISGATVEGYNGNEIIFSMPTNEKEVVDERAKGLKAINSSGFNDNSGLGLDINTSGNEVVVNSVSKEKLGPLTIKVPQNIKVTYKYTNSIYHSELVLRNLKNEIEVSASYNKIKLENNSGPMNVTTIYGAVDAVFENDIKGPVSIISVYGYVDVAIPTSTKANIELSTNYGKLYAADALKIAIEKKQAVKVEEKTTEGIPIDKMIQGVAITPPTPPTPPAGVASSESATNVRSVVINGTTLTTTGKGVTGFSYRTSNPSEAIKGTLNGGGTKLILMSNYKNVYLRSK